MPIKKAGEKALRQNRKERVANVFAKDAIKRSIKDSKKMIDEKKTEEAKAEVLKTIRMLDKAVSKKLLKKNTAARKKSRLVKKLNALGK
jgi:small subunit ribosomal protein S20